MYFIIHLIIHFPERANTCSLKPEHYPFLMVHLGINDTAMNITESINADYEALGRKMKGMGTQVVFSLILPIIGRIQ